jgi:hypothetical protein
MPVVINGTTGITTPDLDSTADISANGVVVGEGGGAVSTNTVVGANALSSNTTGSENTAVGQSAGQSITTGTRNTFVGIFSGNLGNGVRNTAIGAYCANNMTTGENNTCVGHGAGNVISSGTFNSLIGSGAGGALTTASNNIYVGGFTGNGSGLNLTTRNFNAGLSLGNGSLRYLSLDTGAISTSAVEISPSVGIGGMHFVTAYNTSGGAQGWWLIATRVNSVTIIASSNSTGLTINFSQASSVRLTMATTSGTVAGNCHSWVDT